MVGNKVMYNGKEFEIIEISDGVVHILAPNGDGHAILESIFSEVTQ